MLLALLIAAQATTAQPASLSPFKPLLGACWRGNLSPTMSDTHCFEPVYGGVHVRDRHEVREGGKVIYAGETIYTADGPDLVFTYFNSMGGIGRGKAGSADNMLGFTGTMRPSPGDPEQPIDAEWRILDANRYEVRSLVKSGTGSPGTAVVFTRVAP